jgi:hypothetical protein
MFSVNMNTSTKITSKEIRRSRNWRFNPLGFLSPQSLSRYLESFEAGYLRDAVAVWQQLEQRDDLLRGVIAKRKKSVARYGWTVLPKPNIAPDDVETAKAHAAALEYFYNHLRCENAVDGAEIGGFKLLARQMMDAVGKKFAVHEIIWRQGQPGQQQKLSGTHRRFVSATFRFVPLGFFENTAGRLRFLEADGAMEGRDLEPGAWMVTVGDGLMSASATAWMFKNIAMNDWLRCSERNGTPGLRGVSGATRDSEEWQALEQALADLQDGKAVVHGTGEDIRVVDLLPGGNIPFPALVERIDRMLAALWRGADLSTLSRDRGYGASLQEKEGYALEEDDAEMLTETLNRYVDEWVIRYVFGEEAQPLAAVRVLVTPREWTSADLQIDEFLIRHGAPISVQETLNRYGRALPKPGETVFLTAPITSKTIQKQAPAEFKASLSERSQNLGWAEGMENEGNGCGASVGSRGRSPFLNKTGGNNTEGAEDTEGTEAGETIEQGIANEFAITEPEWLQLSPYGDFPHGRGMQRVSESSAREMVARFNSFRSRAGRLFGGLPIYVGHPDAAGANELADRKAYGWIVELEARGDGFYGRAKWSEAGIGLLRNAHFKYLSPFWEAREASIENGRRLFTPVALISVGLTNQPNIPVRPLANETSGTVSPEELLAATEVDSSEASSQSSIASIASIESAPLFPATHTISRTAALGARRRELQPLQNKRDRIQERVLAKMSLGLDYDAAWENVKREHPGWFED